MARRNRRPARPDPWTYRTDTAAAPRQAAPVRFGDPNAIRRASPYPVRQPDPTRETLGGGRSTDATLDGLLTVLAMLVDDLDRNFDDTMVGRMLTDPAVAAPIAVLGLSLIEHPVTLAPARQPDPTRPATAAEAAEAAIGQAVAEFNRAALNNLAQPIEDVVQALSDYPAWGCQLAEIVYEPADGVPLGVGRGLTLRAIKPKPRDRWQFVVDDRWNVVGILGWTAEADGWVVFPEAKFCWLSWWPKGGDPRGTRLVRPAYGPWSSKVRMSPEHLRHVGRFGSPMVHGMTSPDAYDAVEPEGTDEVTPERKLFNALANWLTGQVLVTQPGETVELIESKGGADAFLGSLSYWDRQIVLSILLNARALLEAQHGSRADSESALKLVGLILGVMKRQVARMVAWRVLWRLNLMNFGRAVADRYTPEVSLGATEQEDVPRLLAGLTRAGYRFHPTHLPIVDGWLGLQPRPAGTDDADDETGPAGGDGAGGDGAGGDDGP